MTIKRYSLLHGAVAESFDLHDTTKPSGDYVKSADYDALALLSSEAQSERAKETEHWIAVEQQLRAACVEAQKELAVLKKLIPPGTAHNVVSTDGRVPIIPGAQ